MAAPAQPAKTLGRRVPRNFRAAHAPSPFRRRVIPVARSEARAAAGTTSDLVNAKIVREAALSIVDPDAPEAEAVAEAVALLKEIAPRDAREALIGRRLVAMDALAVETIALARASTGLLREAYAGQAVRAQPGGDGIGRGGALSVPPGAAGPSSGSWCSTFAADRSSAW